MTDLPEDLFTHRRQTFLTAEQADQRQYDHWAVGRMGWFALAALLTSWFFQTGADRMGWLSLVVGIAVFLGLLKRHQAIRRSRDTNRHLAFINEDEAARLARRYLRADTGSDFASLAHPYSADLDLFGLHSLFRLLNRTHTFDGRNRLAQWLSQAAPAGMIFFRQQAIADLKPELDWRQRFEATAQLNPRIGASPETLRQWALTPESPLPSYWRLLRWLLPIVTVLTGIVCLAELIPGWAFTACLALHALLLSQVAQRAKRISEQTHEMAGALSGFRALFQVAETMPGQAARLHDIRLALHQTTTDGRISTASAAIGQLARLTENLNFRRNPYFYLFVGVVLLWDIQYLLALQRWQRQHGAALGGWLDALAELEVLNSLAGFAFAHPDYATPDITDDALLLQAEAAAHPLLPPSRSVSNSLTINQPGQTVLITGSNMSGKSTFLRTVGLNVVLALSGSVVAARRFACSPVQVFTSMRTQDSLEENTSSFYAELKRLQTLLQLTQTDEYRQNHLPILYFLDEILKGTNSTDRHRGAEALIRQLHRTTASGFVSTHDLALGQLSDASAFVQNFHFQSDVIDGRLMFDYTLRHGVCQSFNATALMRQIGIEMDEPGLVSESITAHKTKP